MSAIPATGSDRVLALPIVATPPVAMTTAEARAARVPQLPALTGLRIFAALWVVFSHGMGWWRRGLIEVPILTNVLLSATEAVALFFTLSGFVLAYSYLTPVGRFRGSVRAFYVARVARIWPLYLIALLVSLPAYALWNGDLPTFQTYTPASPLVVVLTSVALVQTWLPGNAIAINNPSYTLTCEAFFYLLFPVVALLIGRLARWQCLLLAPLVCFGPLFLPMDPSPPPIARLFQFLLGVVIGRLFALRPRAASPGAWPLVAIAALLAMPVLIAHTFPDVLPSLLPVNALLLYALACAGGGPAWFLSLRPIVFLGEASYALYLFHWPLLEWITHLLGSSFLIYAYSDPLAWPVFLTYLILLLLLSALAHLHFEIPLRRAIRQRFT